MSIVCNGTKKLQGLLSDVQNDWSILEDYRKRKFLLVFRVKDSTSLVEFKIVCGNMRLNWLISRAHISTGCVGLGII